MRSELFNIVLTRSEFALYGLQQREQLWRLFALGIL